MNKNNRLFITRLSGVRIVELKNGITVAIPVHHNIANAKVLRVNKDGSFDAHWIENFNTRGDFRSELMHFDSNLVLDTEDKAERNKVREANGLVKIK